MMLTQTAEQIALYARRDSPGDPLLININPSIFVSNATLTDKKIWVAAGELTNGRSGGASGMHAEDIKAWLQGIKFEEDPLVGPANVGAVEHWCIFIALVQAIWDHGEIPLQLLWMVVLLIPKGGGDYHGICLLE